MAKPVSEVLHELWEILVPTVHPNGRPIRVRFHRVWDARVRALTGGLTILPVAKGQWIAPDGELFAERMIPVRIACTRAQMEAIVDLTLEYYQQQAVLAFRISDQVILQRRDNAVR
jgi:hypothetical protein